jgi:membrane protease YdiL (CAAX protease family)
MHILDWMLAAYLLLGLPAHQIWKTVHDKARQAQSAPAKPPGQKYLGTFIKVLVPLTALVFVFAWTGRSPQLLGLDVPVSTYGQWGLVAATVLLLWFYAHAYLSERKMDEQERADNLARIAAVEITPRSPGECWQLVFLLLCVGIGWELLFRGFLMLVLPPVTGTVGAIMLSALAYGAGHAYKNLRLLIGSIVSALLFTIAYVLTKSLWWLMLLHTGLALNMLSDYFALRKQGAQMHSGPGSTL